MNSESRQPGGSGTIAALVAAGASVLLVDWMTPVGVADGVFYAILMAVAMRRHQARCIIYAAVAASLLMIAGAWLSPPGAAPWIILTNRTLSLLVIWSFAWVALRLTQAYRAVELSRDQLWVEVGNRTEELSQTNEKLRREVELRTRMEETLRDVVEGISSSTGPKFLRDLVISLTETFNVDCAFVGELTLEDPSGIRFLALSDRGSVAESIVCPTDGTPFASLGDRGIVWFPRGVQERFPEAELFKDLKIECLACTAVTNSKKQMVGVLGFMNRQPMDGIQWVEPTLRLAALRVGTELERIQWEDATRRSAERYRELFENATDIVYSHAPDGRFTSFNRAAERLTGYSRDEAFGMTIYDMTAAEYTSLLQEWIDPKRCVGDASTYRLEILTKDWRRLPVEVHSRIIRDADGGPVEAHSIARDISERLKDEESLRLLSTAITATVEGVVVTDAEGVIQFVNPAFERMTGYSYAEAVERTPRILKSGTHSQSYYENMWGELKEQRTWRDVFINRRKDGSLYYVEETIAPVRNPLGKTASFVAVHRDISERINAELALANERRLLRTLIDALPDQVCIKDPDGHYVTANPAHVHALGASDVSEIVGKTDFSFFPKEHAEHFFADEQTILRTDTALVNQEEVTRLSDGTSRWLLTTKAPLHSEDGSQTGVVAISRDVTEWKQFQQERRRLAMAVEQATEGIAIADPAGAIGYMNPAMTQITGRASDDDVTLQALLFSGSSTDDESVRDAQAMLDEGLAWSGVLKGRRNDDTPYDIAATVFPMFDAPCAFTGYVAIIRDVTQEKQIEAQLRRSQRLQSIGTLAGGIAHDFNNILAGIIGYSEMILTDPRPDQPYYREVMKITEAAQRARNLIRQILTFSRRTEGERLAPIRLEAVVNEALELLRGTLPRTIEITGKVNDQGVLIRADATQLHQVLMNLGTNAYHAMRDSGGVLEVNLAPVTVGDDWVRTHPRTRPGEYLCLSVRDTGHGMDNATLERIFDPFFTTKGPAEGTGLGLATVHGIVSSYGGTITVDSALGKGSTFTVYLPICLGETTMDAPDLVSSYRGTERILVVDDEDDIGRITRTALERLGYHVTVMNRSVDALETFCADPNAFDLIITDHAMPMLTGEQLAEDVLERKPGMPIIITTGLGDTMTEERAMALGLRGYILKPYLMKDLAILVRRTLDEASGGRPPTA